MRGWMASVVGAAILAGGALLMHETSEAAPADNRPVVQFHCVLVGKGGSALSRSAICARFVRAIEPALRVRLAEVASAPATNKGRWISIQVRLAAPASAEAAFTSRLGATVRKHPAIAVDVMDKSLDMREIDLLAKDVAQVLRAAR